jgi:hypothetical protein
VKGKLSKIENTESCKTDCAPGWKYIPSNDPHLCCGYCKPVACVVDGVLYDINKEWASPDHCITYKCNEEDRSVSRNE